MAQGGRLLVRAGWLGAAIGPPSVVLAARWHLVSAHALLSTTLVVAYEGIFAVGAYAANIAGELGRRWQGGIVDHVDKAIRRWISPFDRVYREHLLVDLRRVDVKALTTVGHYTPELDEVFVDVSLDRRAPHQVPADLLASEPLPAREAERRSIWEFVDLAEPAVLAVVGGPGSGKTTLLRHAARRVCRTHRNRRRRVPVLIYLRDHAALIEDSPDTTLPEVLRGTLGRRAGDEPPGWFDQRLDGGDCLVLLDGLDEVGRQDRRARVAEWVERQIRMYPKNDFVITSRPRGYHNARVADATVLQVRPFSHEQVERFVHGWYLAVERERAGADGAEVRSRAAAAADELLDRLLSTPALDELTVNPLLLTMIANVHREREKLPGTRVELYQEICEVILWRRQDAKRLAAEFTGDRKEAALRALAFAMMRRRVRDLPHAQVVSIVEPYCGSAPGGAGAEDLVADVTSNGLLVERERDVVAFAHHSFQEYLAAVHLQDEGLGRVLAEAVDDDWWHLTTLLYAARNDAGPIVRACLESSSATALALALDCADQSEDVGADLREHLDAMFGTALEPGTDAERRDLLARALVTRHLREVVRAGDSGQVVASPVTAGIYRLFLHYVHDDHFLDGKGLESTGDGEPVVGIRANGAVALVRWVNELVGGGYRLPTSAEVADPAVRRTLGTRLPEPARHSVWLEPDKPGGRPALWAPPPHDPYTVDPSVVARQLADDIALAVPVPTLARLRLIRAVAIFCGRAAARDLLPAVEAVVQVGRAFTRDVEGIRDATTETARGRRRDSARGRLRELERRLVRVTELAADLGTSLGSVRDLDPVRSIALELGNGGALGRHLDGLRGLLEVTDTSEAGAPGVRRARALMLDLDRYLARCQALSGHEGLDEALAAAFAGTAGLLDSGELDRETGTMLRLSDFLSSVRGQFVRRTCETRSARAHTVPPDTLAGTVRDGCAALAALVASPESPLPPWVGELGASVEDLALGVASGDEPPVADRVAAIRIASLCVAAEADIFFTGRRVADMFREVAAGITLVEHRSTGQVPVTETVFLALR